jgi:hypothetical protein
MALRRTYMGSRSSQVLLALVAVGLGAFWLFVAPFVTVRHWTSDTNPAIECRQLLTGARQWHAPLAGVPAWTADRGARRYC